MLICRSNIIRRARRLLRVSNLSTACLVRAMSDTSRLFQTSEIADYYLKYRPTYGPDVFDTIVSFCKKTGACDFSLAIDVACGSGQSTLPLTKHFKQVIGVDVSEAQISQSPKHFPNLSFRVGHAEDLSFVDDGSADLVTVAQALHWMDTKQFYPEVERVLKPGGAFVAYGYGLLTLDEAKAQEICDHFYKDVLGPYWTAGRNHVEEHYQGLSLPFAGWQRNDSLKIERSWTVDELVGYFCSWSAYQKYLFDNPTESTMPVLRDRLQTVYQDGKGWENERKVKLTWPVFMLMGHKPQA